MNLYLSSIIAIRQNSTHIENQGEGTRMPPEDFLTTIATWFVLGAVTSLGAVAAYCAIRSKTVQTIGAYFLTFLGGFALMFRIAASIAGVYP